MEGGEGGREGGQRRRRRDAFRETLLLAGGREGDASMSPPTMTPPAAWQPRVGWLRRRSIRDWNY